MLEVLGGGGVKLLLSTVNQGTDIQGRERGGALQDS